MVRCFQCGKPETEVIVQSVINILTEIKQHEYLVFHNDLTYCKTYIVRVHQIFADFMSRIKSQLNTRKNPGLVSTSRTLGKCQIIMQQNFYMPKL